MDKEPTKTVDDDFVDTFIMHPRWPEMIQFIEDHFNQETDITNIDASLESSVIHAEVIARQRIGEDIKSLKGSFERLKAKRTRVKPNYK